MDLNYLYIRFDGRLNRKTYWLANIALILAGTALQKVFALIFGLAGALLLNLIWIYPTFALNVKRAHDRNRPSWMMVVFFALLVIMILMQEFGLYEVGDEPTTAFLIIGIPWFLLAAFFFVDLGFLRGTVGPNRYGPDPLG
jgi:uncharacterized membrane protein YhaH (DUF805 family)